MIDNFLNSYIETALWSSMNDDGDPLDTLGLELAEKTKQRMKEDCDSFEKQAWMLIEAYRNMPDADGSQSNYSPFEGHLAHDFWMTRNRQGVGFWDGDYPEPLATQLTDLAHSFKEVNLYVGDDSLIYQE